MTCGPYVPAILAEFGRTITDDEINNEFDEIERIMTCMADAVGDSTVIIDNAVNLGTVTDEILISSGNGIIQYMTIENGINITFSEPLENEPRLITLVISDGGDGLFNFPEGLAWASDSNGAAFDGKPWDAEWAVGDYGALVTCLYDGESWIFTVFARHEIDYDSPLAAVEDLYNWR